MFFFNLNKKNNKINNKISNSKIAIVGAGAVGSTLAYTLMLQDFVSEIAIIDKNKTKAKGEELDLQHCMQFTRYVKIISGDTFDLLSESSIVVICAGHAQKPGESRLDLLDKNVKIFKQIIPQIVKNNKNCIILVVTNPVDVLTDVAIKLSGFPSSRVFGTGTVLDSARLRYLIGSHFKLSTKDVIAHILGEHGDSSVPWWSGATIAGTPITDMPNYEIENMNEIYKKTKTAAGDIISCKGATFYAISIVTAKIIRSILLNQNRVFTVSTLIKNSNNISGVCLSVPVIVGLNGVGDYLHISLNSQEQDLLIRSSEIIKKEINCADKLL